VSKRVHLTLLRLVLATLACVALAVALRTGSGLRDFVSAWPLALALRPLCTMAASLVIAVGAIAGLRGRTWGVLVSVVGSIAFAGAFAFGIAPPWFLAVAVLGLCLLALVAAPLWRRDRLAFTGAVALAIGLGVAAAALAGPGVALVWDALGL
jgi:hypothetical protein